MSEFTLEKGDGIHSPPCECCGHATRTIWGFVHKNDRTCAVYYVRWTAAHSENGARFDLIVGEWGDGTTDADRFAVMLDCRLQDHSFMVRDAEPSRTKGLASRHLRREDVMGTPVATQVFEIVDFIWEHDARLDEIRNLS